MELDLLLLEQMPISKQLEMEENLLHNDTRNYCIINTGSERTIVLGLSSKPHEMVDLEKASRDKLPIIKRFSGGGTVIVDENTLFVTFIFQKDAHPFEPFPKLILNWTNKFYQSALQIPSFNLTENDYTILDRKVGGNAQYIKKNRYLHHTSFLYDFDDANMDYLLPPPLQPSYRESRTHLDFLTRLKPHISKENFIQQIQNELKKRYSVVNLR